MLPHCGSAISQPSVKIAFKFKATPDGAKCGGFLGYGKYTNSGDTNLIRLAGDKWIQHQWWGQSGVTGVYNEQGNFMDGEWHEVLCAYDRDRHIRYICADKLPVTKDIPTGGRVFDPPLVNLCIGKAWNCFLTATMADITVWDTCVPQPES